MSRTWFHNQAYLSIAWMSTYWMLPEEKASHKLEPGRVAEVYHTLTSPDTWLVDYWNTLWTQQTTLRQLLLSVCPRPRTKGWTPALPGIVVHCPCWITGGGLWS